MACLFHAQLARPGFDSDQNRTTGVAPASYRDVIYLNVPASKPPQFDNMWQEITTAPFDRDLELAVLDTDGPHALVFPCRRIVGGWMNAGTRERIDVRPTHWRDWHGRSLLDGDGSDN